MSRFQVARGQSSKEGGASCPVRSEYSTFLFLRGALLLQHISPDVSLAAITS